MPADTRQPVLLHRVYGAGLRLRPEEGESMYKTAAYTALASVHAAETAQRADAPFICGAHPCTG